MEIDCELGYPIKAFDELDFGAVKIQSHKPLEPCPKPTTVKDAFFAAQHLTQRAVDLAIAADKSFIEANYEYVQIVSVLNSRQATDASR